ncbi:hypothetical protein [Kocuria sp.]|uniref:hypothetical protein n=1 Tax=Kocuria sp. TaxID=1871328 RepID=UPI0026485F5D|nr:hypothetical protein [Kocuria sp.]MDN5632567.1 hypothetical protein [Kocuria sp.]
MATATATIFVPVESLDAAVAAYDVLPAGIPAQLDGHNCPTCSALLSATVLADSALPLVALACSAGCFTVDVFAGGTR